MPDDVVQTPFGKFQIPKGDLIGETLRAGTLWDGPGFLQPLALEHGALGTPGVTILDVGANLGAFSVWLAAHSAWRVLAVEPVPETMRYLKANLDLNREVCAGVVIPVEVAAYDRALPLFAPPLDVRNTGGTSLSRETAVGGGAVVAGTPLDPFAWMMGTRVSFIKVDAQGCDGAVLHGLEQVLARDHPALVFEWEDHLAPAHGYTLDETRLWLSHQGYRVEPWPSHPSNYVGIWHG